MSLFTSRKSPYMATMAMSNGRSVNNWLDSVVFFLLGTPFLPLCQGLAKNIRICHSVLSQTFNRSRVLARCYGCVHLVRVPFRTGFFYGDNPLSTVFVQ